MNVEINSPISALNHFGTFTKALKYSLQRHALVILNAFVKQGQRGFVEKGENLIVLSYNCPYYQNRTAETRCYYFILSYKYRPRMSLSMGITFFSSAFHYWAMPLKPDSGWYLSNPPSFFERMRTNTAKGIFQVDRYRVFIGAFKKTFPRFFFSLALTKIFINTLQMTFCKRVSLERGHQSQ